LWGRSRWRWQDDEILTVIQVPALPAHTAAVYLKYGLLERPSVGVAVAVTALPNQVHEVRVAVGCVGPTPRRLRDVEGLLSHKELSEVRATCDVAGALAGSAADAVTDLHGSAEYKAYIVGVLLRRAFERAYQQAIGGNVGDEEPRKGTA
jgi:CO/xanthine dehydrogenase FAD-binding subunit